MSRDHRYERLGEVLDSAFRHASEGKGHERHDNGLPFEQQPICAINERLGSADFARGQVDKKIFESKRLSHEAAIHELLGAINYAAAAVIWHQDQIAAREKEGTP